MNVGKFCEAFESEFPASKRNKPTPLYAIHIRLKKLGIEYYFFDPLRDVDGMISVKKQRLLSLVYRHLEPEEGYLEIGTWLGKSLISAMRGNPPRPTYACDDFSEHEKLRGQKIDLEATFRGNLKRYGLERSVTFWQKPFGGIFNAEHLKHPIGAYFFDAAHDEESHYQGIKLAEPFLADQALVLIDDWRFAHDSESHAKFGTERAISKSKNCWRLLYELPARRNLDRAMWWNGIAIFAFQRAVEHESDP